MEVGLCASCAHRQVVRNTRGSTFWLCTLSRTDPAFSKYPRIPVHSCSGYVPDPEVLAAAQRASTS